MKKVLTILTGSTAVALVPAAAHAHLGHIGELAGHSHWIGIVLGLAGAAGAAALALLPRDEVEAEETSEASETEADEGADETAGEGQPA